ncbi:MAG TPA: CHASE2 domain-containing protein, partial [Alkalispirochaeta sp.]|nr:CHASE2 domain-containing protein [Alkalispirochaeta sp.]
MARTRADFFATRNFGFVIALLVFGLFVLLRFGTTIPERMELRILDTHFNLKNTFQAESVEEGVSIVQRNPGISEDILIVGIDSTTLSRFGRWPFPRYRHADLINSFARISDQNLRERSLFLDLFFIEPSDNVVDDALLLDAMEQSDRVFLETILEYSEPNPQNYDEFFQRHDRLFDAAGQITNVGGAWREMPSFFGLQPPLQPLGGAVAGYGHANLWDDFDSVYRRQPMVARLSELEAQYVWEDLSDVTIDETNYERLVWFDQQGRDHFVELPLTEDRLSSLRARLEEEAPRRSLDTTGDGEADDYTFVLYHYQEQFIPSITLALALDYFNRTLEDVEVRIGEYIRIPDPQQFDPTSGEWVDYRIVDQPAVYDEDGELESAATYREQEEIIIPIDEQGTMLINYMGRRSSPARDGYQTFPVRPYYGYAARVPGPNPQQWPPTRAVENKIVMVGAFSQGMADDEKLTPYGLMYGVEVHANALNTILMDKFVQYVPMWVDLMIMAAAALLVAFVASRLSTIWAMVITVVVIIVYFFATTIAFDTRSLVMNFSSPALVMLLTFVSIVVYRVMTEEKDKRRIREMFGRYVSPAVVSEILERPPELGGIDKDLTVFFSDIRGFTTLSESMSPQELVNHLN